MAKGKGHSKKKSTFGIVMWYWLVVMVATLLFKFTGLVDVESPIGMLKALGAITVLFVGGSYLINGLRKSG